MSDNNERQPCTVINPRAKRVEIKELWDNVFDTKRKQYSNIAVMGQCQKMESLRANENEQLDNTRKEQISIKSKWKMRI